jgi:hypothetical protein
MSLAIKPIGPDDRMQTPNSIVPSHATRAAYRRARRHHYRTIAAPASERVEPGVELPCLFTQAQLRADRDRPDPVALELVTNSLRVTRTWS